MKSINELIWAYEDVVVQPDGSADPPPVYITACCTGGGCGCGGTGPIRDE